jgi:predicted O-linked N-acetylglucosamine transferase (SPINDLY family)
MRLITQKFAPYSSTNTYNSSIRLPTDAAEALFWKIGRIWRKTWSQDLNNPRDFVYSALSSYRRDNVESAICKLEAGLDQHPDAGMLLEHYLRICCEQRRFARILNFIRPTNTILCQNLAKIQISDDASSHLFHNDTKKSGLVWLTEKVISTSFDDPLALWQLANLLDHVGCVDTARELYQNLANCPLDCADAYFLVGTSEMRLGNEERGNNTIKLGLTLYPHANWIRSILKDDGYSHSNFDRYMQLRSMYGGKKGNTSKASGDFHRHMFKVTPPDAFVGKLKDIELNYGAEYFYTLIEDFLEHLREVSVTTKEANLSLYLSKYLDLDSGFSYQLFSTLHSKEWAKANKNAKHLLDINYKLMLPITAHHTSQFAKIIKQFTDDAQTLAQKPIQLTEPIADVGLHWAPWQSLFCLVEPELYHPAISALEKVVFGCWPKLDYTAPHIIRGAFPAQTVSRRKIRIGFSVLDSMPMMSGFLALLDKNVFETIFLRPGKRGNSKAASDWVARADRTVEYSDTDAYAAIKTIAKQKLDILISGPSLPQVFFPIMARLAHLQMVLLEPNWPDGIKNHDYYISWRAAEPRNYKNFYKASVSLMENPPYWIEKCSLGDVSTVSHGASNEIRQRLLGIEPEDRFYICANTPPKIHPTMDNILYRLLELDPDGYLVLLRSEYGVAHPLRARLQEKLGRYCERVIFLNTLTRDDAHSLLLTADCCIDSYPLCGMSSSFDGLMLGVPIVTLPADIPFGRWTAAIYEYIGVSGLTARDSEEFIRIAMRVANDKAWRREKSADIREKSSRYVESRASFDEFQHFLLQAWRRKEEGLPPANWVAGEWQ